ncbi:LysR family transcriptional regulator [Intestinibacter sp.]|uniref:LysR family transcriptional regulator n=1 Tax=Intestinibacter sp. TaxID=1965304 RepID=UPI003F168DA8
MNIQQLITFLTYSEEKSYTKVALKLNYAVSTVADHIYNLEKEFGVKLISKKGKKGELTESGEILLPYIHSILREYEEAIDAVEFSKGIQGDIKIASIESIALYHLQEILYKFMKKYPNVNMSVSIQDPANFQKLLLREDIDVAIKYDLEDSISDMFDTTILFNTPVVLFCNSKHNLAKKESISKKDLKMQHFIMTQKDSPYTKLLKHILEDDDYHIPMYIDSGVLIKKIVENENVLSLLPEAMIKDDIEKNILHKLNMKELDFSVTAHAMTLKKDWQRPVVKEFLKFIKNEFDILHKTK